VAVQVEADPREAFRAIERRWLEENGVDATSRFVELANPRLRTHVLECGSGEPTVILHGGDAEGADWAPLMGPLQDRLHMFAVDRPGFGLTDAFDYHNVDLRSHAANFVVSLLDALELPNATLIGGSMGGFFALSAALAHPDRIGRVLLIGYPAGLTREAPLGLRLACAVPGATKMMMRQVSSPKGQRDQYRKMFHCDLAKIPDTYFDLRVAALNIPGTADTWAVLLRRIAGLRGIRPDVYFGEELANVHQPTLVLFGERDMAPVETGRAATKRIPNARFEYLPGVAHFPFLEDTDECVRLVREFLDAS
jgi:2-hydroxy-6-oxonona-2,4-dienedioate hydrolase